MPAPDGGWTMAANHGRLEPACCVVIRPERHGHGRQQDAGDGRQGVAAAG